MDTAFIFIVGGYLVGVACISDWTGFRQFWTSWWYEEGRLADQQSRLRWGVVQLLLIPVCIFMQFCISTDNLQMEDYSDR